MIIALNNKSNLTKKEFEIYKKELETINTKEQLILCPTFLNVVSFRSKIISLGAQNVSSKKDGAFTGEISAKQLKSFDVKYTIIGHSERRQYQKESLEEINEKLKRLLEEGIIPILCIGETLLEREEKKTEEILRQELLTALQDVGEEEKEKIIIAYEPVWAIGTGIIPQNKEIEEVCYLIKSILPKAKILYGGSANEENIDTLNQIKDIDGYLLGGLSLKVEKLKVFLEKIH